MRPRAALAVDGQLDVGRLPAAKTASVAQRYDALPPSAFVVSFARWAIAPLIPALATFAKTETRSLPSQARYVTRPRSIVRVVAVERDPRRLLDAARDPERPHEVPARAARDDRDVGRVVEPREPVRDLVDRAVAADDDEQPRAAERRLAGELAEVARPLAEERVALEPGGGRAARELRPAAPRRAVRGRRVDEEDGRAAWRATCVAYAVTVCSASSVIWSTAPCASPRP